MILVGAILLALYVVEGDWGLVLVAAAAVVEVGQCLFWIWYSKRRQAAVGAEALIGKVAQVVSECRPAGTVRVHGELWQARCEAGAGRGERVRVRAVEGLTLEVSRPDATV